MGENSFFHTEIFGEKSRTLTSPSTDVIYFDEWKKDMRSLVIIFPGTVAIGMCVGILSGIQRVGKNSTTV